MNTQEYDIIPFTLLTAHKHGNILEQMFRLRHKGFIVEEKYDVRDYGGIEFDQYDDPHAHYIVILKNGSVIACSRMRPTNTCYTVEHTASDGTTSKINITYMAKDIWPNKIPAEYLISGNEYYEGTRLYVDTSLAMREQMKVGMLILAASSAYMLSLGVKVCCSLTRSAYMHMAKYLGLVMKDACTIEMPGFNDVQYVNVDLTDTQSLIKNLYSKTNIDLTHFVKQHCTNQMLQAV